MMDWFFPKPNLLAWSVAIVKVARKFGFVANASSDGASSAVIRMTGVPSRSVTMMHSTPFILTEQRKNWFLFSNLFTVLDCCAVLIALSLTHFSRSPLKYFLMSSDMVFAIYENIVLFSHTNVSTWLFVFFLWLWHSWGICHLLSKALFTRTIRCALELGNCTKDFLFLKN